MPHIKFTILSIKCLLFHFRNIALLYCSGSAKGGITANKFEGIASKVRVYKNILYMGI